MRDLFVFGGVFGDLQQISSDSASNRKQRVVLNGQKLSWTNVER